MPRSISSLRALALLSAAVCASIATGAFAQPSILINEIDADTPGTDSAEFVELTDGGVGNTALDGLVLVFYNGSNDQSYAAFDLDGAFSPPDLTAVPLLSQRSVDLAHVFGRERTVDAQDTVVPPDPAHAARGTGASCQ